MFTGHYGAAFAAKRVDPDPPLWVLFLAAQWLDVMWGIFLLAGVEKLRIRPGFMAMTPLDLYSMPYSHSLPAALLWSAAAAGAYRLWRGPGARRGALVVGAAVFSHWLLDLLVHAPDLLLWPGGAKVGLGLWNHPAVEWPLELGVLLGGLWLYLKATRPVTPAGRWAMSLFGLALVGLQIANAVGPPATSQAAVGLATLVTYAVLVGMVAWLEPKRRPVAAAVDAPPAAAPAGA